ncbi:hypothetical protein PS2_002853 [Malus domestica]
MDVAFHENDMYFAHLESSLQGENQTEVQTLDYTIPNIDSVNDLDLSGDVLETSGDHSHENNDMNELELSGDVVETSGDHSHGNNVENRERDESTSPDNSLPDGLLPVSSPLDSPMSPAISQSILSPNNHNQSSSILDAPPPPRRLPDRINRGIPKPTYKADPNCKTRYPMSKPNPEPNVLYPLSSYVFTNHLSESNKSFVHQLSTVSIPNNVHEALADPCWQAAMNEELKSLKKNATWEITDLPAGKKPVGCKWVYTIKYKANGMMDRFKARLVVK